MAVAQRRSPVDIPARVTDQGGEPAWGSDLIMDMLRMLGIEYAAILPGSTFRGIHDSAVNYTANQRPELILCNHEMITVSLARGYARVTGKPMAAIVHNVVGLLNTTMTIYDAWCDRSPVLILGGTGPVAADNRRPYIDWIHTANVQGDFVRAITKWDDQPGSVDAIPESLMRAYRIAVTEPAGPVYVCFDVDLQEEALPESYTLPDVRRYRPATPAAADPTALRETARLIVGADLPLCFADRVGVTAAAVRDLVELAELLAMPVVDLGARTNFPTPHALDFAGMQASLLREADVVLGLDVVDLDGALRLPVDYSTRQAAKLDKQQTVIAISLDELAHRGQTTDYQALPTIDLPILGSSPGALPVLLEECRKLIDSGARARIDRRRSMLEGKQQELRDRQQGNLKKFWDRPQISEYRLVAELWEAVRQEDFIFTHGRFRRSAPGIVNVSGPEQHLGGGGAGAVGAIPGVTIGAGLALRDSGKLPVAMLGDGETFGSIQALWTAAHYGIPGLWVVNNNHSYYNDENHQELIAKHRKRPVENKGLGLRMEDPVVDFTPIVKSFGLHAEGPIKDASDVQPAIRRAVAAAKEGQFAVVDVWTENREQA
ncbi:MAG: thiamine pyrophosphate-binding protein [Chloroflexi bacterium]|nr:thiamine pyrophosphate-binding protein [Chloroflexota bacterium]